MDFSKQSSNLKAYVDLYHTVWKIAIHVLHRVKGHTIIPNFRWVSGFARNIPQSVNFWLKNI